MQPLYIYYLRKNATDYYKVENGAVTTTTDKYKQDDGAVMNWDDIQLQRVRHERYHGIMKKQSTDIKFVFEAATILRHCFANGVQWANAILILKR